MKKISEKSANSTLFLKEIQSFRAIVLARHLKRSERVAALVAAMQVVASDEAPLLARELLAIVQECAARPVGSRGLVAAGHILGSVCGWRQQMPTADACAAALVKRWDVLPSETRTEVLSVACSAIRDALLEVHRSAAGARLAIARAVGDLQDPSLIPLILPMLTDAEIGKAAEESLVALAAGAVGLNPDTVVTSRWETVPSAHASEPGERADLHARVAGLAGAYAHHRRQGVLSAAIILLDPAALAWGSSRDPLVRWFQDRGHESHMALRAALKRSPGAVGVRRAWEWLGRGVADRACCERIGAASGPLEQSELLDRAHLVANPARVRRLVQITVNAAAIRRGRGVLPGPDQLAGLSAGRRGRLPALAGALRLPPQVQSEIISAAVADREPAVRFAAFRQAPGETAPLLARDGHAGVAAAASVHLFVSEDARACEDREKLWGLPADMAALHARRFLRADRGGFIERLRERVESGEAEARSAAVMLARRLNVAGEIELELLRVLAGARRTTGEERLAATAASALGMVRTSSVAEALRACLSHDVPRIRANAVESLLRVHGDASGALSPSSIVELKRDPCHRVRANVLRAQLVRALRAGGEPAVELVFMLSDDRPLHRLAALWALERGIMWRSEVIQRRLDSFASRVAMMARGETEGVVRSRAERCAQLLLAEMRGRWEGRAASLQSEAA
jgi:hypothetical protein